MAQVQKVQYDIIGLSLPSTHQSSRVTHHRSMFLYVVGALAVVAEAKRESKFIPGSGCGTFNTIKMIDGNPTLQEETEGCIYVRKGLYNKFRGICSSQYSGQGLERSIF